MLQVGDMFVCEDIKMVIVDIKGNTCKVHFWEAKRDYDCTYDIIQVKMMLDKSITNWKYYPVVK
jgi:hypothetical protein